MKFAKRNTSKTNELTLTQFSKQCDHWKVNRHSYFKPFLIEPQINLNEKTVAAQEQIICKDSDSIDYQSPIMWIPWLFNKTITWQKCPHLKALQKNVLFSLQALISNQWKANTKIQKLNITYFILPQHIQTSRILFNSKYLSNTIKLKRSTPRIDYTLFVFSLNLFINIDNFSDDNHVTLNSQLIIKKQIWDMQTIISLQKTKIQNLKMFPLCQIIRKHQTSSSSCR
ncbi:unnamed protein product [Paramecium octaurelia]|uniref:Uncharacterized protein n=1 Tax=Paramecium octaurelia TaxID=43137 RepID=A0A8S1VBI3_PAROT|nr:unnamed protein product [Paramecium octaurelia]